MLERAFQVHTPQPCGAAGAHPGLRHDVHLVNIGKYTLSVEMLKQLAGYGRVRKH